MSGEAGRPELRSVHLDLQVLEPTAEDKALAFKPTDEGVQLWLEIVRPTEVELALLRELLGGPKVAGAEERSDSDKANALRVREAFSGVRISL